MTEIMGNNVKEGMEVVLGELHPARPVTPPHSYGGAGRLILSSFRQPPIIPTPTSPTFLSENVRPERTPGGGHP